MALLLAALDIAVEGGGVKRGKVEVDKKDGGEHLLHLRPGISATVLSSFLQALKLISFIAAKSGVAAED